MCSHTVAEEWRDAPHFRASRRDGDCDRCKQPGILTSEPLLASWAEVSAMSD